MHRAKLLVILAVVPALLAVVCGGRSDDTAGKEPGTTTATASSGAAGVDCSKETPTATEVGVTADTITIEVMADVGSSAGAGSVPGQP